MTLAPLTLAPTPPAPTTPGPVAAIGQPPARRRFAGWLVAAAALLAGAHGAAAPADAAGVQITGDVLRPSVLDVDALRAFAEPNQASVKTRRETAGVTQETTLRGVRLRAVLEQAGLAERDRYDWRKTVVIASATDGYRVVFSWAELFNTDAGALTLVVHERDGAPLAASEGPITIVAPGDQRSGPRHVKWLNRIEVRVLRD